MSEYKVTKPKQLEWKDYNNYPNYIAEPKYDGERVILDVKDGKITIHREATNIKNANYPEVVESASNLPNCILDGEMCVLDNEYSATFENILSRQTKNPVKVALNRTEIPATFMAFDIKKFENENLESQTLKERRAILNKIPQSNNVKLVKQFQPKDLFPLLNQYNMEGIVLKNLNSTYKDAGLKFKNYKETDFKVVGIYSNKKIISALELETLDGKYVGRCNWSKYPCTEEWANKVVGMIAVVQHFWTRAGKVRIPVLKELRNA